MPPLTRITENIVKSKENTRSPDMYIFHVIWQEILMIIGYIIYFGILFSTLSHRTNPVCIHLTAQLRFELQYLLWHFLWNFRLYRWRSFSWESSKHWSTLNTPSLKTVNRLMEAHFIIFCKALGRKGRGSYITVTMNHLRDSVHCIIWENNCRLEAVYDCIAIGDAKSLGFYMKEHMLPAHWLRVQWVGLFVLSSAHIGNIPKKSKEINTKTMPLILWVSRQVSTCKYFLEIGECRQLAVGSRPTYSNHYCWSGLAFVSSSIMQFQAPIRALTSNNGSSVSLMTTRCSQARCASRTSRQCLQTWQPLLNITGGALELPDTISAFFRPVLPKRSKDTEHIHLEFLVCSKIMISYRNLSLEHARNPSFRWYSATRAITRNTSPRGPSRSKWIFFWWVWTYSILNQRKVLAGRLARAPFTPSEVYQFTIHDSNLLSAIVFPYQKFLTSNVIKSKSPFIKLRFQNPEWIDICPKS